MESIKYLEVRFFYTYFVSFLFIILGKTDFVEEQDEYFHKVLVLIQCLRRLNL